MADHPTLVSPTTPRSDLFFRWTVALPDAASKIEIAFPLRHLATTRAAKALSRLLSLAFTFVAPNASVGSDLQNTDLASSIQRIVLCGSEHAVTYNRSQIVVCR